MKIKKMKVGTFNLKKYLFLYMKGHFSNGLMFGEVDDRLDKVVDEVRGLFLMPKSEGMQVSSLEKRYPYIFDKDGNQIGGKVEDYKDD